MGKSLGRATLATLVTGLVVVAVLPGCEVIAGYTESQPWPAEAGPAPLPPGTIDDASTREPFELDTGLESGSRETLDASDADAGACPVRTGGDVCTKIPRFGPSAQVVDGHGDEFCDIPATVFAVNDAAFKQPQTATRYPQRVRLRAAWSDAALHVHVHVTDPRVLVATNGAIVNGDAVVLYVGASAQATGAFNGLNDGGAVQVFVTPASGTFPARAYAYYYDPPARVAPIDPSLFASRLVPDGYEIEMRLPWSGSKDPQAIKRGGRILLNPGLSVKDDPAMPGQELEVALALRPLPGGATTSCPTGVYAPWCDDRTWCSPALE